VTKLLKMILAKFTTNVKNEENLGEVSFISTLKKPKDLKEL
jgi:hypothetical protein